MPATSTRHPTINFLWLCLRFPYLSMNCLGVRFADAQAVAVTVQQSIYLVNQAAAQSCVVPGQCIGHALMINPDLQLFEHDPAKTTRKLEHLSNWAYRFSSQVHVFDEHTLLIEIGRSLCLFKGLKHLQHLISHDLEKFAVDVVYGLAHTPKAAHLLSFSEQRDWQERDIEAQLSQALIKNLAIEAKTLEKLTNCGFKTLSDVLAIPDKEIGQRFDQSFIRYLQQLLGRVADPLLITMPSEHFSRTIDFAEPIRNRNWIEQQIDRLLQELITFMQERNLVCRDFSWCFYAENNRLLKKITINLASAKPDFATYRELTDLQFAKLSMRWEFSSIRLGSNSLVPRQQFHSDLFNPKADQEGIHQFIEKLSNRLGVDALFKVSTEPEHLPEFASRKRRIGQNVASNQVPTSGLKDEPLCLLEHPQKLSQENGQPVLQGVLCLIHGPHRVCSHWWKHLHSRDYYIARQNNGRLLWVYHERRQQDWYLHGLFS